MFVRILLSTDDLHEIEGPRRRLRSGTQRAERLADRPALDAACHRDNDAGGMIAERGGKGDLFPGSFARRSKIRRAKLPDQLRGQQSNDILMVLLCRIDDLNQRGTSE